MRWRRSSAPATTPSDARGSAGRALIVEAGDTRGALAAVRALARTGWRVGVATPAGRGLAATSRYAKATHRVPEANLDGEEFLGALQAATAEGRYDVILAGGDAELTMISANRDRLTASVPHAPHETVIRGLDKLELGSAGRSAGWSIPDTELAPSGAEPSWRAATVVKPRIHSPAAGGGGPARIAVTLADGPAEAVTAAEMIRAEGGEPLFQEFIAGRLAAFVAVCDEGGEIIASAAQVADAISSESIGVSVRARSVDIGDDLREAAMALFSELGWFGIAEIQFMLGEDGRRWLIDLNGRLYGSLQLAIAAGANLPAAWAAVATGRPLPDDLRGWPGVGFNWMQGGLARAIHAAPGQRSSEMLAAVRLHRNSVGPIWMASDPMPAVTSVWSAIRQSRRIQVPWTQPG